MDAKELIGETLAFIDVGGDEIQLTTASGRIIKIMHYQNCCESVSIQDTKGDWHSLVGKVLTEVTHDEEDGNTGESSTLTTLTFKAGDETVINRWIGESNGYYSESVSLEELAKK